MNKSDYNKESQRLFSTASLPGAVTLIALFMTESLFLIMEIQGLKFPSVPAIPISPGWIKSMADMVIIILLPWNGWVFAFPLIVFFSYESGIKKLVFLFMVSTVVTAAIPSIFSFPHFTFRSFADTVFTYSAINVFVLVFVYLVRMTIIGIRKCRQ